MRIDTPHRGPGQSRLAAIGVTLLALAIAYFLCLHWWFVAPLMQVDAQIQQLQQTHAKYAAAIAQQPELEKRVQALERGGSTEGTFLAGTDPSAASADLIQRASDVVAAHANEAGGCSMPSKMPIEQDHANQAFQQVSVSITLDCGMQPLVAVLHDFDRGLPYLFVSSLNLARANDGRLQAQFTLSGYLRPTGAPAGDAQ